MNFKKRMNTPMQVGFIFLIIAGLSRLFVNRITGLGDGLSDGIVGFCYGVAIASLLLGIHKAQKSRTTQ